MLRPLKRSWVSSFEEKPERIYHGDTPLGKTLEDVERTREAAQKHRKDRAEEKRAK